MSLRSTLPLLGALVLVVAACAAEPPPDEAASPAEVLDARPVAGAVVSPGLPGPHTSDTDPGLEPHDDPAEAGSSSTSAAATGGDAARARLLRGSVPKDEICALLGPPGCDLLPGLLSPAEVALVEWVLAHLDGPAAAAGIWLETAHAVCATLDEISWNDMVIAAEEHSRTGSDPEVGEMIETMPFFTPQATTFLCPEHAETARTQMTAAVCSELSAEVCAAFEEDWLS